MLVYTANKSNECGTGQRHEQGKNTTTDYYLLFTSTYTVLLIDGATNIHSKITQEKTPSQTRESDGASGPLSHGALVTERAPRDMWRDVRVMLS